MSGLKIDRVLVGEALVGEGNELAHIDLIMGPRGSPAEIAFCSTLTNQKRGDNALLALVAPNLMAKPATVMFNKVEIRNENQANQMFGPAERGVAKAVVDCVKEGNHSSGRSRECVASASSSIGRPKTIRKSRIGIMRRLNWQSLALLTANRK